MFRLFVNADDFGICNERDNGIVKAFKDGIVRGATIIANGQSSRTAAELASAAGMRLGLHLNLTEVRILMFTILNSQGKPLTACSSLVDQSSGQMLGKLGFREALSKMISMSDIENEISAQVCSYSRLYCNIVQDCLVL